MLPNQSDMEPAHVFQQRVCEWEQEKSKMRIQKNTQQFKEELMMNRWHPTRLDALLEKGVDVDML